ncbi:ANTAR domain-containing response regulator [Anaerocolumna xylanovorans]|uniref:Response regulator NasT n=1 Tax=Anaerocolumna xylanovorans DSM 12503 TaxID=1121345 RepID=A0A1M7YE62_9FIRM|nr:ANTAR domain-containing protein [Anaerocolumna xylanovorans]SHO50934.1 response regulator NasT [Anaerocolumna xylanovorans DSM 12503]
MPSIIIAFPKIEDAVNIKNVLVRNGYGVNATCTTGAQVVTIANELDDGIIICGYRFSDMHYSQLNGYLPKGFEMLLIASANKLEECTDNNIVCLSMPIKMADLISTLEMMHYNISRRRKREKDKPKARTEEEKAIISKAKLVLMERNNMTEEEAHRYIQKNSMDSGTNMVEMAEMILRLM